MINGHFRNLNWRYLPFMWGLCKGISRQNMKQLKTCETWWKHVKQIGFDWLIFNWHQLALACNSHAHGRTKISLHSLGFRLQRPKQSYDSYALRSRSRCFGVFKRKSWPSHGLKFSRSSNSDSRLVEELHVEFAICCNIVHHASFLASSCLYWYWISWAAETCRNPNIFLACGIEWNGSESLNLLGHWHLLQLDLIESIFANMCIWLHMHMNHMSICVGQA